MPAKTTRTKSKLAPPQSRAVELTSTRPSADELTSRIQPLNESAISERAHQIWLEEGCPDGRAEVHWGRAQQELLKKFRPSCE